jgi:putative transposase
MTDFFLSSDPLISPFWSPISSSISCSLPSISHPFPSSTFQPTLKCRLFSLNLSSTQKIIIQKWFSLCTYAYNQVIDISNNENHDHYHLFRNSYKLRSAIIDDLELNYPNSSTTPEVISKSKSKFCPYDVVGETILEAHRNVKQTWKKNKINKSHDEANKRKKTTCISIDKKHIRKSGLFKSYLGKLDTSKFIHSQHMIKLIFKDKKYYVSVPEETILKEKSIFQYVSIDPGVRSFSTCYYSKGAFKADLGNSLVKYQNKIDKLNKKLKTIKNYKKKRSICDRINICNSKTTNKVKDFHYQTADTLCLFKNILIPVMNVKQLSAKLGKKVNRKMYAMSHFKFRMRLKNKANERGCNLIFVNESYTSKTCSFCGEINQSLGSKKWFKCNSCKKEIDRDENGAKNILIRYLTKVSPSSDLGRVSSEEEKNESQESFLIHQNKETC